MSLSPEAARQIIESGTAAPSGDNLQPWLVTRRGDTLQVRIDRARDVSIYNFRYRPSHIALGAMVENMAIAAREHGLRAHVTLSEDDASTLTAHVTFTQDGDGPDPLFSSIARRCTNRKPYERRAISAEHLRALRAVAPADEATLQFVDNLSELRTLARAAS